MATTLAARLGATLIDYLGVEALANAYALLDPTASFATIITQWQTWLTDLDACTDAQIINAALHVYPALPGGLKGSPTSLSRVEQTGVLNFSASGSMHRWGFAIPALSNAGTVISAGPPPQIVLTSGGPIDVLRALLAGGGTANLAWTNANQQALVALLDTLISFRERYKRQLAGLSFER